jgi:hypothetical protein
MAQYSPSPHPSAPSLLRILSIATWLNCTHVTLTPLEAHMSAQASPSKRRLYPTCIQYSKLKHRQLWVATGHKVRFPLWLCTQYTHSALTVCSRTFTSTANILCCLNGVITLCIDSNTHLLLLLYIYNTSIPSNTTKIKDMVYSYMFRLIVIFRLSQEPRNFYRMAARIWDPRWLTVLS